MELGSNNWCFSKFPKHVLELNILPRLGLRDLIRFSAVCRSCRSMVAHNLPYLNRLPWLMLSRDVHTSCATFFSIMESKLYHLTLTPSAAARGTSCIGSSRGYLIMATWTINFLFNPFSKKEIHLPRQYVPREIFDAHYPRLRHYFKKAIMSQPTTTSQYVVSALSSDSGIVEMCRPCDREWSIFGAEKKVVNRPLVITFDPSSSDDESEAESEEAEEVQEEQEEEKLNQIVPKELNRDQLFHDILFYKGMLLGLKQNNGLISFELQNDPNKPLAYTILNVLPMDRPTDANFQNINSYIVESCTKDLLMIYRFSNFVIGEDFRVRRSITKKFQVFKLCQSSDCFRWIYLQNIGDEMLFLGRNSSMSFSAIGIPGARGNCIYFTDDLYKFLAVGDEDLYTFSDNGIYYLEDGHIESLFSDYDSHTFRLSQPLWVTPDVVLGNNV